MKIYYAGAIRGGRDTVDLLETLLDKLQNYGSVLTEHIGLKSLTAQGESEKKEDFIYRRDLEWLDQSDIIIAEVTQPSLGVGYELAYAESKGKRVVCLFNKNSDRMLSAMVRGNSYFEVYDYLNSEDLIEILEKVFSK